MKTEKRLPVLCRVMSAGGPREICRLHPLRCEVRQRLEPLGSAMLVLTAEEGEAVQPGLFLRLEAAEGKPEYYRVQSVETQVGDKEQVRVEAEHALCTLAEDVIFGALIRDLTTDLITDAKEILSRQTMRYWQYSLEASTAMSTIFRELTFENCTLLQALLQIGRAPQVRTVYETDFTVWPWKLWLHGLNLVSSTQVRLNRNLKRCRMTADRTEMATRLYPLGAGEGVDQCGIAGVEPNGRPYVQDDEAVSHWGIISRLWVDTSVTAPETLYAQALSRLEQVKDPVVTVEIDASDLSQLSGESFDRFVIGRYCQIALPQKGLTVRAHIVGITYRDLYGDPADVSVTLSNDYLGSTDRQLAQAAYRVRAAQVRTRGSVSEDSMRQSQTLLPGTWTDFNFFISGDIVSLNSCMLNYSLTKNAVLGMRVDGRDFPLRNNVRRYEIASALTREEGGRVARGAWHSVSFYTDSEYVTMVLDLKLRSFLKPLSGEVL